MNPQLRPPRITDQQAESAHSGSHSTKRCLEASHHSRAPRSLNSLIRQLKALLSSQRKSANSGGSLKSKTGIFSKWRRTSRDRDASRRPQSLLKRISGGSKSSLRGVDQRQDEKSTLDDKSKTSCLQHGDQVFRDRIRHDQVIDVKELCTATSSNGRCSDESSGTLLSPATSKPPSDAPSRETSSNSPAPYSLLPSSLDLQQAKATSAWTCSVDPSQIVDILPCTPLQEGMMALTEQRRGAYVSKHVYEVGSNGDLNRLRDAWAQVVKSNDILRTRMVSLTCAKGDGLLLQVVLDEEVCWTTVTLDQSESTATAYANEMGLGKSLSKVLLVENAAGSGSRRLIWVIHHSLFDGWTLPLVIQQVQDIYHGKAGSRLQPMSRFIKYLTYRDHDSERHFWTSMFQNHQLGAPFPPTDTNTNQAQPNSEITLTLSNLHWQTREFTPATLIKAAWAIATASSNGSSDSIFGLTLTGRQSPLPGIEHITGPTIATVPVAVSLDWGGSVDGLLRAVQAQAAEMIPYEHTGLQRIAQMSEGAARGCRFRTLLVIQPAATSGGDGKVENGCSVVLTDATSDCAGGPATDPYPIVIECWLGLQGAEIRFSYDSKCIAEDHVGHVTQNFVSTLKQLNDASNSSQPLAHLQSASWNMHRITNWNSNLPAPTLACIHEMIQARAREQPLSQAIHAWDGDFTYREVDDLSTRLASHLAGKGLQGRVVPLLFEKSKWMPIAAVAVMKAGGACLALGTEQPADRLRSILTQAGSPSLVLSSSTNAPLSAQLGNHATITIRPDETWSTGFTSVLPLVDPSDVLYVCFTSGSTGVPKGAVVTHSNFASAITHQQTKLGFLTSSRVFDFSSYIFDAAWCNLIHSLTSGACLCIPSLDERTNDLPACFAKYNINHVDLTPSVARIVGKDVLARLSTLILGGEAVLPSDALLAPETTRTINVYGPAECTPTVTLSEVRPGEVITIGRGHGVRTWVVDPDTETLSKVGQTGELWVDGPLVGQGYLNNEPETDRRFINNPAWLVNGIIGESKGDNTACSTFPPSRGKFYRTGDLVAYLPDGSLRYVGRADFQVKIRGQRVELGEVEQHVLQALPRDVSASVVAEMLESTATTNSASLVAFISLEDQQTMTESEHASAVESFVVDTKNRLTEIVPSYLIPTAFIPIKKIPLLPSGKTDRKALCKMGASLYQLHQGKTTDPQPTPTVEEALSDTEILIQRTWMSVLNLQASEVGVTRDFTRIGGDSITAMQIVSQCKLHNVIFTVGDLLQASTIRNLAHRYNTRQSTRSGAVAVLSDDETSDPFGLSPIQSMFFNTYPDGMHHWNQSFLLRLTRFVSVEVLENAVTALVSRHAMLRSRFQKDARTGVWTQRIISLEEQSEKLYAFSVHSVYSHDEVATISQQRQEAMHLQDGPVFACDLFQLPGDKTDQMLLLSAHHAVVDLVSWRIIWGDIEDFVDTGSLASHLTMSFQQWCRHQARVGASLSPLSVLSYHVPSPPPNFWGLNPFDNTMAGCKKHSLRFDKSCTDKLFQKDEGLRSLPLRAEPLDVLIGAMTYTFFQIFPERETPTIWMESHGREQLEDNIDCDVSSTVGWFTTMSPLPIPVCTETTALRAIRLARDIRQSVPKNGQPYFSCRYHSESGRAMLGGHESISELIFNFTGKFQQLEKDDGLFAQVELDRSGSQTENFLEVAPESQRSAMIEVIAMVEGDELNVSFDMHRDMQHQDRLQAWIDLFCTHIEDLMSGSFLNTEVMMTLSDFPLLPELTYRGLDTLLQHQLPLIGVNSSNVADMYPCSPLQQGILLSTQKGSATYATFTIWNLKPSTDAIPISVPKLQKAWEGVVDQHTIFHTIFTTHPETGDFIQVVLKDFTLRLEILHSDNENPAKILTKLPRALFADNEPNHALTICHSASGQVSLRLDVSHCLIDGASMDRLLQDLVHNYANTMLPPRQPFKEMIRHLGSISQIQRVETWSKFLQGVQPCDFPVPKRRAIESSTIQSCAGTIPIPKSTTQDIASFCRDVGITRSVFLHVAWAMALSQFTGSHDVCFGYVSSGRDAPVDDIETMIGPLANLLINRVNLRRSPVEVLQQAAQESIMHLSSQHTSLAEIQHHLHLSERLFNSALSVRGSGKKEAVASAALKFEAQEGEDPHEFPIGVSALIDGESIDLVLEYNTSDVPQHLAREAAETLGSAVRCLLHVGKSNHHDGEKDRTLDKIFFKHIVGQDQDTTEDFWREQFKSLGNSHFPVTKPNVPPQIDSKLLFHMDGLPSSTGDYSWEGVVRTGWALLAARMSGNDEAIFGAAASNGTSLYPVRISLPLEITVASLLQRVELQAQHLRSFEQTGLCYMRSISDDIALAVDFSTVVHVRRADEKSLTNFQSLGSSHVLFVLCKVDNGAGTATFTLDYDSSVLCEEQVSRMAHQLKHILRQLLDSDVADLAIEHLDFVGPRDIEDIWNWNKSVPSPTKACVHDLIASMTRKQTDRQAICAWDGKLSYKQLDELSSKLATQLLVRGVGAGSCIPLLFDKSVWMPVAAIAVMKTGAAGVATDASTQPEERLRLVVEAVNAPMILCSASNKHIAEHLGGDVLVVDSDLFIDAGVVDEGQTMPVVDPEQTLYVVFTSGSTGTPKGVAISHTNMASNLTHQSYTLGYRSDSRVLDFCSYAFDVSWSNLLNTLTNGGCLCIPSLEERQSDDLSQVFEKYDITLADMTPSVARRVKGLERLQTLILGGEAVLSSDARLGGQNTKVVAAYGPAECTPTTTITELSSDMNNTIGKGVGVCTWIVNPENPSKLSPIGTPGELWVEGPLVGQGYLNDKVKTSQAYIQNPEWLLRGAPGNEGRSGRPYRTGDLVQYLQDGSLRFLGRKDTQIKLRGQRIELEEVQGAIRKVLFEQDSSFANAEVVVQVIQPEDTSQDILSVFISIDADEEHHDILVKQATLHLTENLIKILPLYMIPSLFIPQRSLPKTPTGKIDRKALVSIGNRFTKRQLADLQQHNNERVLPQTEAERRMADMWMSVLEVEHELIGLDTNFFQVGGDSIGAIKLVGYARRNGGYELTVRDIFLNPTLRDMAALCS